MAPFHWTCPYCDRDTTITDTYQNPEFSLTLQNAEGLRHFSGILIACPNPKCNKFTFSLNMYQYAYVQNPPGWRIGKKLQTWNLIPPSSAKVFPDYVPKPI